MGRGGSGRGRWITDHEKLDAGEAEELVLRYQCGDMQARDRLVWHYQRLVYKTAADVARKNNLPPDVAIDDLAMEGNLALLRAIQSYDESEGWFFPYAQTAVRNAAINTLKSHRDMSGISRAYRRKYLPMVEEIQSLIFEEGLPYDEARHQVALEHGVAKNSTLDRAYRLLAPGAPRRFEEPLLGEEGGDGRTLGDRVGVEPGPSRAELVMELREVLDEAFSEVPYPGRKRERDERAMRLVCLEGYTLEAAGDVIGVSRQRVQQIRKKWVAQFEKHGYMPVLEDIYEELERVA